jgi:hypothetical protein
LTYFRNRIRLIKILFLEIFIHLWMNSKFDCIVCRRTRFYIPFDISVTLYTFYVLYCCMNK